MNKYVYYVININITNINHYIMSKNHKSACFMMYDTKDEEELKCIMMNILKLLRLILLVSYVILTYMLNNIFGPVTVPFMIILLALTLNHN